MPSSRGTCLPSLPYAQSSHWWVPRPPWAALAYISVSFVSPEAASSAKPLHWSPSAAPRPQEGSAVTAITVLSLQCRHPLKKASPEAGAAQLTTRRPQGSAAATRHDTSIWGRASAFPAASLAPRRVLPGTPTSHTCRAALLGGAWVVQAQERGGPAGVSTLGGGRLRHRLDPCRDARPCPPLALGSPFSAVTPGLSNGSAPSHRLPTHCPRGCGDREAACAEPTAENRGTKP